MPPNASAAPSLVAGENACRRPSTNCAASSGSGAWFIWDLPTSTRSSRAGVITLIESDWRSWEVFIADCGDGLLGREKGSPTERKGEIVTMLQAVTEGDSATYVEEHLPAARPRLGWESLTYHERRVARLAAQGLTVRQLSREAFLSRQDVESELREVFHKLGITSRASLGPAVLTHLYDPE